MRTKPELIIRYFDELLLFSGQYALFYILMNFTADGLTYFSNLGHTILLLILVLQTGILVKWGNQPIYRFLGSLIAPLCYTFLEMREGLVFLLNIGHVFFWFFSIITGSLQAIEIRTTAQKIKLVLEFWITTINVSAFIFIYFYFDLKLEYGKLLASGQITEIEYKNFLGIQNLAAGLLNSFGDPTHVYIVFGGLFLSLSLSIGRMKIILLKDKISELFGTYVDKGIRDKILTTHSGGSERKSIAILFSDIRNFTTISENNTPDEITQMLNYYFTQWDYSVIQYQGVIDKYIGDAIMVLFGTQDQASAAQNATACAIEMIGKMEHMRAELARLNLPVVQNFGIGINFGSIIFGDIGSQNRKNFTVVGDNVNIASRLESLCKKYGIPLIISETTYEQLDHTLQNRFKLLGETDLKGKADTVNIYGLDSKAQIEN
ncbi:MAG: adenylate/guanylate cyclase domain-containing protein [SAR324 cluster bacterium]|nr:adenylate/guanylate cyclase domain-containing protein [SAR324 cluster bacterium]